MSQEMSISRIRQLFDTGWGRRSGWTVERDNEVVAELDDVKSVEMFWDSYRLELRTPDEQLAGRLLDAHFWQEHFYEQGFLIRSKEFGLVAGRCLVSHVASGRLSVRGLYVTPPGPAWKVLIAQAMNLLQGRQW